MMFCGSIMKNKRLLIVFLFCICFLLPVKKAYSTGSSSPPVGIGTYVAGCCYPSPGCAFGYFLATPRGVSKSFEWISDTIEDQLEDLGESYEGEQKKITSAWKEDFKVRGNILTDLFIGWGQAGHKIENTRNFGSSSKSYLVDIKRDELSNLYINNSKVNKFKNKINNEILEYSNSFELPKEVRESYKSQNKTDIDPKIFFPSEGTNSIEQTRKAKEVSKMLVSPFPDYKNGNEKYKSLKMLKESNLELASSVFTEVISEYAPIADSNDFVNTMFKQMGGEGNPPQVNDGKISMIGILDLLVNFRFANDDWRTGKNGIHKMNNVGLLRELLRIKAIRLEIENRKTRRSRQLATLLAQGQILKSVLYNRDDLQSLRNLVLGTK